MLLDINNTTVCVVGTGYVGLPLTQAFAKKMKVISFDIDKTKENLLSKVTLLENINSQLIITH